MDPEIGEDGTCVLTLKKSVQFGKEMIDTLTLKFHARALKGFTLVATADGGVVLNPYEFAALGLKLAGQPSPVLDLLSADDFKALGKAAQLFVV